MKSAAEFAVALVTAPDMKVARALAEAALRARLAACVNLLPGVESHYRWQGRLERGTEVLLVFKTRRGLLAQLEQLVLAEHPYDTPEFLVVALVAGQDRYLRWLGEATHEFRASGSKFRVPKAGTGRKAVN